MFGIYLALVVLVIWRDANFWRNAEDVPDGDYLVETLGWITEETGPWLYLAAEKLPDQDGYRAVTRIPVADICDVIDLTPKIPLATETGWELESVPA